MGPAKLLESGTIRSRLTAALVLLAALPVLTLLASVGVLEGMSGNAHQLEVAGGLRRSTFIVAAHTTSNAWKPAPYKRQLAEEELNRMMAALAALESGSANPRVKAVRAGQVRQRLADAQRSVEEYQATAHRLLAAANDTADATVREHAGQEAVAAAYKSLATTERLVAAIDDVSASDLRRLRWFETLAVAVALLVLWLTIWAVRRVVLGPLPALATALAAVESGRYGIQLEAGSQNEVGQLVRGFNAMSATLERAQLELAQRQADILDKNAELERSNRLKSEFVANMSHELRTPLHAIIGYTKLMRTGVYGTVPDSLHEPLAGVDETSASLLRLINDILDLAKIEAGRMEVHLEAVDVRDVVREVAELLQPLTVGKGLALAVRESVELEPVMTDRDKLRRIVLNLAGNALKFTRRGHVDIEIRTGSGAESSPRFEIAVHDTGIGIAPESQALIFEDFRQVDGSSHREYGGSGLGLSIARRLARQLKGDIVVESRVGEGSTFTVWLPVVPPTSGARLAAGRVEASPPGSAQSSTPWRESPS